MSDDLYLTSEQIARVCHEANRAYCMSIGDHSQPTWDMAPPWQKKSATNGVLAVVANPDQQPQASHESWMAEKEADGWKYGPRKIPEKKEHPCLVPYAELPEEQTAKDHLFLAVAKALAVHTVERKPPMERAHRDALADAPTGDAVEVVAPDRSKRKRGKKAKSTVPVEEEPTPDPADEP